MSTPQGRDWTRMEPADFNESAPRGPLALIREEAVVRPVPAVPDAFGTEALFGDDPAPRKARRAPRPAPPPTEDTDTLF
ncbi:hypothetical protein ABZV52_30075 [Streptomyces sp. NPDC004735]|uniref:hypothetical protein n=1 Tax=Streptomyces TaxID=1883 RepID=UPI0033A3EF1B